MTGVDSGILSTALASSNGAVNSKTTWTVSLYDIWVCPACPGKAQPLLIPNPRPMLSSDPGKPRSFLNSGLLTCKPEELKKRVGILSSEEEPRNVFALMAMLIRTRLSAPLDLQVDGVHHPSSLMGTWGLPSSGTITSNREPQIS